jgi:transposase
MRKLDICLIGLALVGRVIGATGGACMPIPSPPQKRPLADVAWVYPNAAGLAIGSAERVVAVPPDRDPAPVRVFLTLTPDLHARAAWVIACGIDTVAMESTGVFWIPIDELLEQHGIVPYRVNARHGQTVPGRPTDWHAAPWRHKRHALGLLQASFRPDAEIRTLRTLVRYRAELIERHRDHNLLAANIQSGSVRMHTKQIV